MALQHFWTPDRFVSPVHFYGVLTHKGGLQITWQLRGFDLVVEQTFQGDMCVRPFDRGDDLLLDRPCPPSSGNSSIPARLHFSFHKRLSSARILQLWQVWAASNRSRGSRKDNTLSASSFGSNEMKSLWNWGSITCIMCRTCVGSQLEFPY